jgi:hypothetical protein
MTVSVARVDGDHLPLGESRVGAPCWILGSTKTVTVSKDWGMQEAHLPQHEGRVPQEPVNSPGTKTKASPTARSAPLGWLTREPFTAIAEPPPSRLIASSIAERMGDRGRLVHGRTDTGGLPAVDGGEQDLAVLRGSGDRAGVAGEEAAGAGRHHDLPVGGEPVAAGHAVEAGAQRQHAAVLVRDRPDRC